MEEKNYFRTQNRQLAFALAIAGCQPAPMEEDGPAVNLYTLGFLRQPRFAALVKGKGIEEAASELIKRKIPGAVTYVFERCKIFDEVLQAWDALTEELQRAAQLNREPVLPDIPPKVIAQVLAVAVNCQETFNQVPFVNKARQLVSNVESSTNEVPITDGRGNNKPAGRTVTTGKGKVWTVGASAELKRKLNVK